MKDAAEHIREIAEKGLESDSFFLVEVKVSKGSPARVTVLLDGDEGVNIDDCSKLSRHIGKELEEDETFAGAYTLDVGSPGLDHGLVMERQYKKNVGRRLKVKKADGEMVKGDLVRADEVEIELKQIKKDSEESQIITFNDIEWAKVQVSFK